ncbi:MAG: hypothetical protein IK020_02510 [Clostridiales bacterium]|nr:hypothetical protein [Clostridiales bacterium]
MKRKVVSGIVAGIYMVIISIAYVLVPTFKELALSGWKGWIGLDILLVASSIIPAICLYVGRLKDNSIKNPLTYVFWIWYLALYVIKLAWMIIFNDLQDSGIVLFVLFIVGIISITIPLMFINFILAAGGIEMSEEKKKEIEEAKKHDLERQLAAANSEMQRAEVELKERQDQCDIVQLFGVFFKALGCNDYSDIFVRQQELLNASKTKWNQACEKVEQISKQID